MHRRSLVAVLVLVFSLAAGRADALTVKDVIELSKAGLSDPVLLALIDVDRSVFSIDTETLKQLKSAGVSDPVVVAMIRSGREPRPEEAMPPVVQPEPAPEPPPQESAEPGQEAAPAPAPYAVAYPVPVYIGVPIASPRASTLKSGARHAPVAQTVGPAALASPNCQAAQLPQWGFGGTIRQLPPVCR
jgi:hypothetical protein